MHISDAHGTHNKLQIPECDVLVFTGDIGARRADTKQVTEFLIWFEKQPAKMKILHAGNHDTCLDPRWIDNQKEVGTVEGLLAMQQYQDSKILIESYGVKYLNETDYVYEGVKFFGSPYTPSFHRKFWAFNADRGEEIKKRWAKIPGDVDVLLTHGPAFGILDMVPTEGRTDWHEDGHVGCKDLADVIKNRLFKLKLHCFGHIHSNYGVVLKSVSNTRNILFSNGCMIDNGYKNLITKPLIIDI